MFRKGLGADIGALAEEHYRHDLKDDDRTALQTAASRLSTHATIGSVVGLGLGVFLAYKLRTNRAQMFAAFKTSEKPTHIQFAGGRSEPIPDLTPLIKPSTFGDIATYTFLGMGGLFFGGETGVLTGSWSASNAISRDPESKKRIEGAFRNFRAEVLRTEADMLEKGQGAPGLGF